MNLNICYSGGSKGADQLFGELAEKVGHQIVHWSFEGHYSPCKKRYVIPLKAISLAKADTHLIKANQYLKRTFPTKMEYVNNLLRRNYYQITDSERVYSSTPFDEDFKPLGGTSWAIVMGIDIGINEFYNYDINRHSWIQFNPERKTWYEIDIKDIPTPYGKYTGIGSSELSQEAAEQIRLLYNITKN